MSLSKQCIVYVENEKNDKKIIKYWKKEQKNMKKKKLIKKFAK